jgi:hypothetical protein
MEPNYRRCISCRVIAHKRELLRIVRCHDTKAVQLNAGMGRSAYLCPKQACLQAAQKKKQLNRALRAPVGDEIYRRLAQQIDALSNQSES